MIKPLTNTRVLLTRPADQSKNLSKLLHKAGAKTYAFPTLDIIPEASSQLTSLIKNLDAFQRVIFTSTNAVKHSTALIKHHWPTLPAAIRLAAIGNSTKIAIEEQGWICDISPEDSYSSAALLRTPEFQTLTGKNVLIVTGKNGLNELATRLREQKNTVKTAICYQRKIPNYPASSIIDLGTHDFDVLVLTSNESLKNLSLILDETTLKKFKDAQIFAFSTRINTLAKHLGFSQPAIITAKASDEALVQAILQFKRKIMTKHSNPQPSEPILSPTSVPKNRDMPKLTLLIAIVLSVFALVESTYVAHTTKKIHAAAKQSSQQMTDLFNAQTKEIAAFTDQLKLLQTKIANNTVQINANQNSLQSLKEVKLMDDSRWTLAEIKYLLTMAQYNLKLTPAPETALAILQKANAQLIQLNAPSTLPLRQEVISAIAQLKAIPKVDYPGILMQLNALSGQLIKMPLFINNTHGKPQSLQLATETQGWHKYWNASLKTLEKLVVIRHQNRSVEPLISPKEQLFLEENIQAKLSQASWALLQHNQAVYHLSLQQALDWVQMYYTPNAPATLSVTTTLQSLMKINFSLQLPDLTPSILLTNQLLNAAELSSNSTGVHA